MDSRKKNQLEQLRRWRIRKKVSGTAERPRMAVKFSNEHIYVQFIDDIRRVTLAATSSLSKELPEAGQIQANVKGAAVMGKVAAQVAQSKGIKCVVFDRAGKQFHGKVKALADAAREAGLQL